MASHRWELLPVTAASAELELWERMYQAHGRTPLLHPDFLRSALEIFDAGQATLCLCRKAGDLVALCVTAKVDGMRTTTFQPSQAPIGFWLQRPEEPIGDLLRTLSQAQTPWTLSLAVTQQDPDLLARPSPQGGLQVTDYIDTARITIDGDWDAYWKARGSNLRHNIKRACAKVANAGKTATLRLVTDPAGIAEAVSIYGRIESRSWKASGGTAITPDNDQGRFYARLLERFARRGKARCYQLVIDDEVAATDLCVCGDEEIVILKTTYDADYKDFSPAFLMREMAFKRLYSEGWCRRIEFYGRVMDWHLRWTEEIRRMYHVTWFRYAGALMLWRAIKRMRGFLEKEHT